MRKLSQEKALILLILICFIVSGAYLGWTEYRYFSSTQNHPWWNVYFDSAKDSSLDFTIENHGASQSFMWVLENGDIHQNGTLSIPAGQTQMVAIPNEKESGRVSIQVSANATALEIYKILK